MKMQIGLLYVLVLLLPALAFATPPVDLSINYDLEKTTLHVSAKHPTDRLSKHFLRTINVYKNDEIVKTVGFGFQQMPSGIENDISIDAGEGDKISVEVLCSQGGSANVETVVAGKSPEVKQEDVKKEDSKKVVAEKGDYY